MPQVQTNTTSPTARQQEQQGSGNPNLSQILNQNAGYASAMGGNIANRIGQQANQFQTQTSTAQQNYQNQLEQAKQTGQTAFSNASQILGGNANPNFYQTRNASQTLNTGEEGSPDYSGLQRGDENYYANIGNAVSQSTGAVPMQFGSTVQGQMIGNQAQNLQGVSRNLGTGQGQQSLLNTYLGRGNYTPGQSALDRALLSQNQGAQQQIVQAGNQLGQTVQNAQNIIGEQNTAQTNLASQLANEKANLLGNLTSLVGSDSAGLIGQIRGAGNRFNTNIAGLQTAFRNTPYGQQIHLNPGMDATDLQNTLNQVLGPEAARNMYMNRYNATNQDTMKNFYQAISNGLGNTGQNGTYMLGTGANQALPQLSDIQNLLAFARAADPTAAYQSGADIASKVIDPTKYLDTSETSNFGKDLNLMKQQQAADAASVEAFQNIYDPMSQATTKLSNYDPRGKGWGEGWYLPGAELIVAEKNNIINNQGLNANQDFVNATGLQNINDVYNSMTRGNAGGIPYNNMTARWNYILNPAQRFLEQAKNYAGEYQNAVNTPRTVSDYLNSLFENGGKTGSSGPGRQVTPAQTT